MPAQQAEQAANLGLAGFQFLAQGVFAALLLQLHAFEFGARLTADLPLALLVGMLGAEGLFGLTRAVFAHPLGGRLGLAARLGPGFAGFHERLYLRNVTQSE
ncbi:pslO [Pseudomonas aeruginosa]|nr:pslO [Pseudomonas aeruginosa]